MVATYYQRGGATHVDGTEIFQTEEDRSAEAAVAKVLEAAWRCRIASFGLLSPVDWYAERDGRLVGVLELKSRSHEAGKFETVWLNVRKWLALQLASVGLNCPAIFVVQFLDGIWWVPLREIEAGQPRVLGCTRIVKSVNDQEPVIDVPVAIMREVRDVIP